MNRKFADLLGRGGADEHGGHAWRLDNELDRGRRRVDPGCPQPFRLAQSRGVARILELARQPAFAGYFPVSAPPASTNDATTPIGPSASIMSSSSTGERCTRLYGSWAAHGSGDASSRASAIHSAGQFTTAHARAFPAQSRFVTAFTTSYIASSVGGGSE